MDDDTNNLENCCNCIINCCSNRNFQIQLKGVNTVEFEVLGKKIIISEGQKNYFKIFSDFVEIADSAKRGFNAKVANRLKSTNEDNYLNYYYLEYVEKTKKYISRYGIYTVSDDEIWTGLKGEFNSRTYLDREYYETEQKIRSEMLSRAVRHEGDFSYFELDERMDNLADSEYFDIAIYNDVMRLFNFTMEYLRKNQVANIEPAYAEEANEAAAIYDNLLEGNVPFSEKEKLAISLIQLDFSEEEYYEYIFQEYPQSRYEIVQITNYLGIDMSDLIEADITSRYNLKSISSEEDAIGMMSDLKLTLEKYGVNDSSVKRELNKILVEYDIKARTYDGEVYSTRILRAQAEKDDLALVELVGKIYQKNKTECNDLIIQIKREQYTPKIAQKHIENLKARICTIDKENLEKMVSAIDGKNEKECNAVKTEIANYDAEENLKESFFARIDKRIKNIWEEEDFNEFSMLFMQTRVSDYFNINKNVEYIREKGRTETKEKFIHAFLKLNEEDVTSAAKYVISKDGGMLASLFNMGKKDIYETLTLNERVLHPSINEAVERVRAEKEANKGKGLFGAFSKIKAGVQSATTAPAASTAQSSTTTGFKFCTECGNKIAENSKFCPNCGSKQD